MKEIYMMWFPAVVSDWALIQEFSCDLNFLKHDHEFIYLCLHAFY